MTIFLFAAVFVFLALSALTWSVRGMVCICRMFKALLRGIAILAGL